VNKAAYSNSDAVVFLSNPLNFIVSISSDRVLQMHRWKPFVAEADPPFLLELEKNAYFSKRNRVGLNFASSLKDLESLFAVFGGGKLFSCGYWDFSLRISLLESGKTVKIVKQHQDVVTCIALDEENSTLITGSMDSTVVIWSYEAKKDVTLFPRKSLYGHDAGVTCVALSCDLDIVISGSLDGTCIFHSVCTGEYIRTIRTEHSSPISKIVISSRGNFVVFCESSFTLSMYSINGTLISQVNTDERLNSIRFSKDSDYLLTGGTNKTIIIRDSFYLNIMHKFPECESVICTFLVPEHEQHLLVGLKNGSILIYSLESVLLRQRMLAKLSVLGF
jgi:WD40 repeat protein